MVGILYEKDNRRRLKRLLIITSCIYVFTTSWNQVMNIYNFDLASVIIVGYIFTLIGTALIMTLYISNPKIPCQMCQNSTNELRQPKLGPANIIRRYGMTYLCDGCMVRHYYPDMDRQVKDIEKYGSLKFYQHNEDQPEYDGINKLRKF